MVSYIPYITGYDFIPYLTQPTRVFFFRGSRVDKCIKKYRALPHSQGPKIGVQMILQHLMVAFFLGGAKGGVGGCSSLRTENMAKQVSLGTEVICFSSESSLLSWIMSFFMVCFFG